MTAARVDIHKYTLELAAEQVVRTTLAGEIPICAQSQKGELTLWTKTNPSGGAPTMTIIISHTGSHTPVRETDQYISTIQNGPFVWHVFVRPT